MEVLSLSGISKEYGKSLVLNNVNLTINEGDVLGIIGVSGSGKSTLLNIMVGFLKPEEGTITIHAPNGKKTHYKKHTNFVKQNLGYNPQGLSYYPKLTVWENLMHFGRMYKVKKQVLVDNANNLLKFTGLADYKKFLAEELSGGMQKRLDIACSLVHKPKILILDEPVINLDPSLKRDVLHLLEEVNRQGVTVVIASHDLDIVDMVCNKVAILHEKHIYSAGLLEDVKKPYHDGSLIKLRTGKHHQNLLKYLKGTSGLSVVDNHDHLLIKTKLLSKTVGNLTDYIEKEQLGLTHLELSAPTLKSVFENITSDK